ncbi:hypothetical protein ACO0R3_002792, partial [Hanseniaspora guilliermondii]
MTNGTAHEISMTNAQKFNDYRHHRPVIASNFHRLEIDRLRSRSLSQLSRQITPPTKNGHAPPPTKSRKSSQSVNPYCKERPGEDSTQQSWTDSPSPKKVYIAIELRSKGSIGHTFMVCIHTENQNQGDFYPFVLLEISVLHESPLGHLRYRLTDVPPQPNSPPDNVFNPDQPVKDVKYLKEENEF